MQTPLAELIEWIKQDDIKTPFELRNLKEQGGL